MRFQNEVPYTSRTEGIIVIRVEDFAIAVDAAPGISFGDVEGPAFTLPFRFQAESLLMMGANLVLK